MIIETKRLLLRPWKETDAEDCFLYAQDPEVGLPCGWPPHKNIEETREILANVLMPAPEGYAVCLKSDGRAIGCIELMLGDKTDMSDREDEGEIGYWLGKPFWGQGIMPEAVEAILFHAFTDLHMRAVWCGYYEGNEKSKRVQEKCGFSYHHTSEGLVLTRLNEIRTGYANLLTKEDWERLHGGKNDR